MKIQYKKNNYQNSKILNFITVTFLVLTTTFIIFNLFFINFTTVGAQDNNWNITLKINESFGLNDTVIFGEKIDATNGKDKYDTPKPPPPQIPYIRAWFATDLEEPYNILWEDYRTLSEDNKTWNLTVLWISENSSTTNITISWEISEFLDSGQDLVYLLTPDIVDMKVNNNYQFTSSNYEPHNFQIIFQKKELNGTSDTNNISSTLIIGFIIVIVIIIIAVYIMKRK